MFRSFSVFVSVLFSIIFDLHASLVQQGGIALDPDCRGQAMRTIPLSFLMPPFAILPASQGVRCMPSARSAGSARTLSAPTSIGDRMEDGGSNRSVLSIGTASSVTRVASPRGHPELRDVASGIYGFAYGCGAVAEREKGALEWDRATRVAVPTIASPPNSHSSGVLSAPLAGAGQDGGASPSAARGQLLSPSSNRHHGTFLLSTAGGATASAEAATSPMASALASKRLVFPLFDYAAEDLRVLGIICAHACSKGKALGAPKPKAVFTVGKKKRA